MIRLLTRQDLQDVLDIEKASFPDPWNEAKFMEELDTESSCFFGLFIQEKLSGYILIRTVADECTVLSLAVAPDKKRQGTGRKLMEHILSYAKASGIRHAYLEVRARNLPALNLYASMEFKPYTIRKNYYGSDDAILMHRSIP